MFLEKFDILAKGFRGLIHRTREENGQ